MMRSIDAYSLQQLREVLADQRQPPFRLDQLISWLYQKDACRYEEMTNLPRAFREHLASHAPITKPSLAERRVSLDGTRKYLVSYPDGSCVETVAIPSLSTKDRLTVCVSTQVGCPMRCLFCATGREGFVRNLGSGEIVRQVMLAQSDIGSRATNLVAMGQGEPFLNYDNVLGALRIINSSFGLGIGARKITVSTCGIVPGIERFASESEQFTLAVSLHSARQSVRNLLMSRVSSYPLPELKKSLASYIAKTNRRVTLEYLLLEGVNDSPEDLEALLSFCKGLLCHVNLLSLNEVAMSPLRPSDEGTVRRWLEACSSFGIEATRRASRGADIEGACGQLKQTFSS